MPRRSKPGIFCLEGQWSPSLKDGSTVRPLLEFLANTDRINFIYRDVGTPTELRHYVEQWTRRAYGAYPIGYFAFHGDPGCLYIGGTALDLEDVGDLLAGTCEGKILYFGSCSTLQVGRGRIDAFRHRTRARSVCGYVKPIDWFPSAAFELMLFDALTCYKRLDAAERWLRTSYPGLVRQLGFRLYR